jgi:serine/threonine protein kinase
MALSERTRLGPYEILSALGAGGMGEVYRARDTKLNRQVAIKVLPEIFADDPERLARFHRERRCWPRSTIRTSRTSTASRIPARSTRW